MLGTCAGNVCLQEAITQLTATLSGISSGVSDSISRVADALRSDGKPDRRGSSESTLPTAVMLAVRKWREEDLENWAQKDAGLGEQAARELSCALRTGQAFLFWLQTILQAKSDLKALAIVSERFGDTLLGAEKESLTFALRNFVALSSACLVGDK
jgi:hypothetical protein